MEVLDSTGRVIGSDYLSDAVPIVTVTVPRGDYRVRVSMESCSWDPCGTVLMFFKRN
ncbi:hypothetical protein [Deinococcus apachensis]|uniref:hypothetical protein n=1 Tax=Deinococcus apachensis TaxID=309886 RepID=UPI000380AC4C|nr:hypothetical protein [Deinococcus apachensis]